MDSGPPDDTAVPTLIPCLFNITVIDNHSIQVSTVRSGFPTASYPNFSKNFKLSSLFAGFVTWHVGNHILKGKREI